MKSLGELMAELSPKEQVLWSRTCKYPRPKGTIPFFILSVFLVPLSFILFFVQFVAGIFLCILAVMLGCTCISHMLGKKLPIDHYILTDKRALVYYSLDDETVTMYYDSVDSLEVAEGRKKTHTIIMKSGGKTVELRNIPCDENELGTIKGIILSGAGSDVARDYDEFGEFYERENHSYDAFSREIPAHEWTDRVREALEFMNFYNKHAGEKKDKKVYAFGEHEETFDKRDLKSALIQVAVLIALSGVFLYVINKKGAPNWILSVVAGGFLLFAILMFAESVFSSRRKYTYVVTDKHFIVYKRKWSNSNHWVNLTVNGRAYYNPEREELVVEGQPEYRVIGIRKYKTEKEHLITFIENIGDEEIERIISAVEEVAGKII